jgi:hypothetical protein
LALISGWALYTFRAITSRWSGITLIASFATRPLRTCGAS